MMKPTKSASILLMAALAVMLFGFSAFETAQAAPQSSVSRSVKGGTLKIKLNRDAVNKKANLKVSGKGRDAGDIFHVNNHCGYTIDIYVDGSYAGTVAPYGDLYIPDATGGEYTTAAGAPGTDLTWGPRSFTTPYTWNLY